MLVVQKYIEDKQEQADAIVCSNPGVLEEFRAREARIAELDILADEAKQKVDTVREHILQLKVSSQLQLQPLSASAG